MSGRTFLLLLVLILIIHATLEYGNWRRDRRPKFMGNRVPLELIMPNSKKIQRKIVLYHNFFRTKVLPRAANMLRMKWHQGASRAAQKWSEKCMFLTHDNVTGRYVDNYGSCGQNIFVASHKVPWLFAIQTWYLEKDNFTYGSKKNDLKIIGHYTQMVWASTHEVGCGLSKCMSNGNITGKVYYNYVCNYCPIGNKEDQLGRPYRRGKPCTLCKQHCHARKLCTNACHAADLWANCKELHQVWPQWLCNSATTSKGQERMKHCKATCTCRNRICD